MGQKPCPQFFHTFPLELISGIGLNKRPIRLLWDHTVNRARKNPFVWLNRSTVTALILSIFTLKGCDNHAFDLVFALKPRGRLQTWPLIPQALLARLFASGL